MNHHVQQVTALLKSATLEEYNQKMSWPGQLLENIVPSDSALDSPDIFRDQRSSPGSAYGTDKNIVAFVHIHILLQPHATRSTASGFGMALEAL